MKRKLIERSAVGCLSTILAAASCALACTHAPDLATESFPDSQKAVRARLDEIWAAAGARDVDRLASYHLYGPKFTEFKDGVRRGDAVSNEQGERGFFSAAEGAKVQMHDLRVTVFGEVAIATFNGEFSAKMNGEPIASWEGTTLVFVKHDGAWKLVHEHFSPLGPQASHP